MNERFPRLLIMTHDPPDEQHGGAQMVQQLAGFLPKENLCWFSSRPLRSNQISGEWAAIPFCWADLSWRRPNRWGLDRVRENFNFIRRTQLQAECAAQWGRRHRVEAVWVVMHDLMIASGPLTANLLKVPYHASVHDLPEYLLLGRLGSWGINRLNRRFFKDYAFARSRDVISGSMREYLMRCTGCDAEVLTMGIEGGACRWQEKHPVQQKNSFEVHHAGMLYDASLLHGIILECEEAHRQGRLCRVNFVLSGSDQFKPKMEPWPKSVTWLGWLPREELRKKLETADLLYLQQPFDRNRRRFAETSFPTKLPIYLASGSPILFHVPPYSSVYQFATDHRLPLVNSETDPKLWIKRFCDDWKEFSREWDWEKRYAKASAAFDLRVIRETFTSLIRRLR